MIVSEISNIYEYENKHRRHTRFQIFSNAAHCIQMRKSAPAFIVSRISFHCLFNCIQKWREISPIVLHTKKLKCGARARACSARHNTVLSQSARRASQIYSFRILFVRLEVRFSFQVVSVFPFIRTNKFMNLNIILNRRRIFIRINFRRPIELKWCPMTCISRSVCTIYVIDVTTKKTVSSWIPKIWIHHYQMIEIN